LLVNPLPGTARIAIVTADFRTRGQIRCLPPDAVGEYHAEILAGSADALLDLPRPLHEPRALIALTGYRYGALTRAHRDRLWSAYGVPVFENHLDSEGQLIASECEAHDGLHLVAPAPPACVSIREGECDCGRLSPRIFFLAPFGGPELALT
jgi:hypothetical protein